MPDTSPPSVSPNVTSAHGWWGAFFDAFIYNVTTAPVGGWLGELAESVAGRTLTVLVAFAFKAQSTFVELVSKAMEDVDRAAAPTIVRMAAQGLGSFFGVAISPGQLPYKGGQGANKALAEQLGTLVFQGLYAATGGPGGPTGEQALTNSKTLIGLGVNMAITGYVNDAALPPIVDRFIPAFKELKNVVGRNLGLGSLPRMALAPLLNAHIVVPLTRHYNKVYRQALPTEAQAARVVAQDPNRRDWYFDVMAQRGYTRELAGFFLGQHTQHLSVSDIKKLVELREIGEPEALTVLGHLGYAQADAAAILKLMVNDRVSSYLLELASLARRMYAEREISDGDFRVLCEEAGLSDREQAALFALASLDRARPARLPRSTMETAFEQDVVSIDQLRAYYELEGYAGPDVVILETLAVRAKVTAERKAEAKPPLPAAGAGRALTQGQVTELFRRGLTTEAQATAQLTALGFKGGNLELMMRELVAKRKDYQAALARQQKPPKAATLPRSTILEAYVRDLVTRADLEAYYLGVGYSQDQVDLLLQLADIDRDGYRERAAAAAANAALPSKTLSES